MCIASNSASLRPVIWKRNIEMTQNTVKNLFSQKNILCEKNETVQLDMASFDMKTHIETNKVDTLSEKLQSERDSKAIVGVREVKIRIIRINKPNYAAVFLHDN